MIFVEKSKSFQCLCLCSLCIGLLLKGPVEELYLPVDGLSGILLASILQEYSGMNRQGRMFGFSKGVLF